jgi:hypothetical protein
MSRAATPKNKKHDASTQRVSQSSSLDRLKRRYDELVTTEKPVAENLTNLLAMLQDIKKDAKWMLDDENKKILERTSAAIFSLRTFHESLATAGSEVTPPEQQGAHDRAACQLPVPLVIFVLQKKAGGKVIGDKAVGTLQMAQGTLAASLWELQVGARVSVCICL